MASSKKGAAVSGLLLAVLLLQLLQGAAAQTCANMYRKGGRSLLFGGVGEANRCVRNCQSRTDFW
jgi:hypothetical protein